MQNIPVYPYIILQYKTKEAAAQAPWLLLLHKLGEHMFTLRPCGENSYMSNHFHKAFQFEQLKGYISMCCNEVGHAEGKDYILIEKFEPCEGEYTREKFEQIKKLLSEKNILTHAN